MRLTKKHHQYWHKNLSITAVLLALWFLVTFVASYFAGALNGVVVLGFPLGFYLGAQGSLVVYLLIVWFYVRYMNRLDRRYGVDEGSDD